MRRLIALFVSGLFSLASFAEADGPDYWRVSGVSDGNVLNVRSTADSKATKIGKIPSDAQCVKNRGCKGGLTFAEFTALSEVEKEQVLKQRPRWCRVSYQGMNGWVAGRYLRESHCGDDESRSGTFIDPLNHSYKVEGEIVSLSQGSARVVISGSAAYVITEAVTENTVFIDMTGDNKKDAVQILMQQTGGSGSFYYLALAASENRIIESYFLGDRIKVKKIQVVNNNITVTYLDRDNLQAMSDKPTVSVSKSFELHGGKIVLSQ